MSAKAFGVTAYYDSVISNWLNDQLNIKYPEKKTLYGKLVEKLRYGENPHQEASLYKTNNNLGIKKIHGKKICSLSVDEIKGKEKFDFVRVATASVLSSIGMFWFLERMV